METILILARALEKASHLEIICLSINYSVADDEYVGSLFLGSTGPSGVSREFTLYESGEVEEGRQK